MKLASTLTLLQPYEYIEEKQKSLQPKTEFLTYGAQHVSCNCW